MSRVVNLPYKGTYASTIAEAVERVGKIRTTAGDNVDLCLELQCRMKRGEAIALAHTVEKYTPMFLEALTIPGGTSNWSSGNVDASD